MLAAAPGSDRDSVRLHALGPQDLDRLEALHRLSMGPVPRPEVVKPERRDFFVGILGGRGRAWGVFDGEETGEELVAYGILQHAILPDDDPRSSLGVAPTVRLAKLAGAGVAPGWRGRGLQRLLIARRIAEAGAAELLFSTAAPLNAPSWCNLIHEGFAIRALVTRYGGLTRYLLTRERAPVPTIATRVLAPGDHEGQRALLAAGWRGVGIAELDGAPAIGYAPPAVDAWGGP